MVEAIPNDYRPGEGQFVPKAFTADQFDDPTEAFDEISQQASQANVLQRDVKRKTLFEREADKLPVSLWAKPNKQSMDSVEYARIVRELMENRDFLNDDEREAFKPYVIQGIPQS